jgi:hypothetical protein
MSKTDDYRPFLPTTGKNSQKRYTLNHDHPEQQAGF